MKIGKAGGAQSDEMNFIYHHVSISHFLACHRMKTRSVYFKIIHGLFLMLLALACKDLMFLK